VAVDGTGVIVFVTVRVGVFEAKGRFVAVGDGLAL